MKNIILYPFFLLLLNACGPKTAESENPIATDLDPQSINLSDAQIKNADITYTHLEEKNIAALIKVNGKIDVPPQNMISVSMPLGGYLKTTQLLPGMHVAKGESIAVLEDLQYIQLQQAYLNAKAQFIYYEKELERQSALNQSKASSDKVLQQAQLDFNTNKIELKALSEKLKLIGINPTALNENSISKSVNLYSPIDGFVSKVNVNIGKYVNPSDILFELVNTNDIHLNLTIFEKDIATLYVGQKVMAYTNQSNKKYDCEIILIGHDLSAERSAEVHCHFQSYDASLMPGMYMNAEIETLNKKKQVLPETSIVDFEGKSYVFMIKEKNKFQFVEVQLGTKENGLISIENHKDVAGQKIVNKGAYTLLMALKNKAEE
jgi:cobalt-zinc-cadmium efflux system membrane fusion protein